MNLPACLDELLEQKVNRKSRNEARRTMRVLEKAFPGAVRYACFSAPIEMEKLFEDVIRVARKTYQWGLGVGFQDNEEHRKRLRLEAEKGRLRAYVLYLKDEPVAFWIGTVYKDTFWLDFTGYDPAFCKYEVGTVLFLRMIGNMCGQNVKLMDLGLGSAFYKERFGDSSIEESTMRVFAFSGRGVLFNTVWLVTQALTKVVRGLLLRLGLEQKVKKLWRARSTAAQESTKPLQAEI
jgi:CelD/BcsL family acetyltransferase involved in cellulose biosynthesis